MSAAAATLHSLPSLLPDLVAAVWGVWLAGWLAAPAAAKSGWNFEFPNGLQSLLNLDTLLRHMSRSHQPTYLPFYIHTDTHTYLHAYLLLSCRLSLPPRTGVPCFLRSAHALALTRAAVTGFPASVTLGQGQSLVLSAAGLQRREGTR
jgi:hypothetical protein